MSNYLWVKNAKRQALLDTAVEIPEFSKKKISEILELALEEFVKKHGKSNNPQTSMMQFNKEGILAIPNIYEAIDNPKMWEKFYSNIKSKKEFKELDEALNQILRMHNKTDKKKFV